MFAPRVTGSGAFGLQFGGAGTYVLRSQTGGGGFHGEGSHLGVYLVDGMKDRSRFRPRITNLAQLNVWRGVNHVLFEPIGVDDKVQAVVLADVSPAPALWASGRASTA